MYTLIKFFLKNILNFVTEIIIRIKKKITIDEG